MFNAHEDNNYTLYLILGIFLVMFAGMIIMLVLFQPPEPVKIPAQQERPNFVTIIDKWTK